VLEATAEPMLKYFRAFRLEGTLDKIGGGKA
jgi:hypothetical protein